MSVNFADMQWLVTMTSNALSDTYGPLTMTGAVEMRDSLRAAAPDLAIEAWAAQSPNLNVIKPPEQAWNAVSA